MTIKMRSFFSSMNQMTMTIFSSMNKMIMTFFHPWTKWLFDNFFFIHEQNKYDNFFHPWTKWLYDQKNLSMNKMTMTIFFIQETMGYEITLLLGEWERMCVCVDEFIHHTRHHHIVGPRTRADNDVDEFQLSWRVHHPHPSIHSSCCIGCCLGFRTL
jgi:hypothetical protein